MAPPLGSLGPGDLGTTGTTTYHDDKEGSPPLGVGPKAPRPMAPLIGGKCTLERLAGGVTIPLPVP